MEACVCLESSGADFFLLSAAGDMRSKMQKRQDDGRWNVLDSLECIVARRNDSSVSFINKTLLTQHLPMPVSSACPRWHSVSILVCAGVSCCLRLRRLA